MTPTVAQQRRCRDQLPGGDEPHHDMECLLEGLDDIGLTLEKSGEIASFEEKRQASQPWL